MIKLPPPPHKSGSPKPPRQQLATLHFASSPAAYEPAAAAIEKSLSCCGPRPMWGAVRSGSLLRLRFSSTLGASCSILATNPLRRNTSPHPGARLCKRRRGNRRSLPTSAPRHGCSNPCMPRTGRLGSERLTQTMLRPPSDVVARAMVPRSRAVVPNGVPVPTTPGHTGDD